MLRDLLIQTCRLNFGNKKKKYPEKSKVVRFAKGPKKIFYITINGIKISPSSSFKFLGRIINSSLTTHEHYKDSLENCNTGSNVIKLLTNIHTGLPPRKALNVYKSIVRSKIEYPYSTSCNAPAYTLKKIQTFQHSILRRCTGLSPSTPTSILRSISYELPVAKRIYLVTAKELLKVKIFKPAFFDEVASRHNHVISSYSNCFKKFSNIFNKVNSIPSWNNIIHDKCVVELNLLNSITNSKKNRSGSCLRIACLQKLNHFVENNFKIYATDGSINSDISSFSIIEYPNLLIGKFKVLQELSSTFIELLAIRQAIIHASEIKLKNL
ncbi:uncharacterized protein ACN2A1_013183 [Glossina fuscipes fuscipes]